MTLPTPQETNLEVAATAAEGPPPDTELLDLDYWRHQLTPQPELLGLPTDHARSTEGTFAGACVTMDFPDHLALLLRSSIDHGLFVTLLGGWQILLWRLSGNADPVTLIPACLELDGQNDLSAPTWRGTPPHSSGHRSSNARRRLPGHTGNGRI